MFGNCFYQCLNTSFLLGFFNNILIYIIYNIAFYIQYFHIPIFLDWISVIVELTEVTKTLSINYFN